MRNYSRLRKAELIAFLQGNEPQALRQQRPPHPNRPPPPPPWSGAPQMSTWEPQREPQTEVKQPELEEAPLTKRQLKRRQLDAEISNLKSQMDALKDKITRASKSTNAGFKRKKIRSMKREADKINEKLAVSEAKLELIKPSVPRNPIHGAPLKLHPLNRSKCIEAKIAKLNKKIRRAKNRRNKEHLITKREALKAKLNWNLKVRLIERAFGAAYSKYRIDGAP